MPLPLAALLMEIEMADQFVFYAHLTDYEACAIEAQDRITVVRARMREQLRKGLAEIIAATERGCSCDRAFSSQEAAKLIEAWDEILGDELSASLADLYERAGGEE
jgi:hypothetical protein